MAEPENVRAITLMQPWAFAVTDCGKRIENRAWAPRQSLPLLIHAGVGFADWAGATFARAGFEHPKPGQVVRGAILAVTSLVGVCTKSRVSDEVICDCGLWAAPRQLHWQLGEVRVLPQPVACRGRQQLWLPTPDVLADVSRQLIDEDGNG